MSLKIGLLAMGIAMSAVSGAAKTGAAGGSEALQAFQPQVLYATLAPLASKTHTVIEGENDWKIAKKYGVSVEALHKANPGTNWRALQIGQKLTVPVAGTTTTAKATGGKHTVKKGENDNTIAKKYGVTVSQLHAVNSSVDWRKLQIGQKINLPGGAEDTSGIGTISSSKVKVKTNGVNVRTEPTTSSSVRTTVDKGLTATVLDRSGAWYELRFPKGTTGWVRGDMLIALKATSKPAMQASKDDEDATPLVASDPDKAQAIIETAMGMLGTRYKWGGTSRGGVDCSGLTTYVFSHNGISLPRTSIEQSKIGNKVMKEDLQAGDLLFFVTGRSTHRINHVGIYIGEGKFIHASSYRHQVVVTKLDDYSSAYAGARRIGALQKKDVEKLLEPAKKDGEAEQKDEELFPSRVVNGADKTGK